MARGPTQDEYDKYTKGQKVGYWVSVIVVLSIIGGLLIKKFFFS